MVTDGVALNDGSNFYSNCGSSSGIAILGARTAAVRSMSELGSAGAEWATTLVRRPRSRQGGGLVERWRIRPTTQTWTASCG
jgi:hypothetical protein